MRIEWLILASLSGCVTPPLRTGPPIEALGRRISLLGARCGREVDDDGATHRLDLLVSIENRGDVPLKVRAADLALRLHDGTLVRPRYAFDEVLPPHGSWNLDATFTSPAIGCHDEIGLALAAAPESQVAFTSE